MNLKPQLSELNERKWDARTVTYDQKRFGYFRWMHGRVIELLDLRSGLLRRNGFPRRAATSMIL